MVASVPELTRRTCSRPGMRATISSAIRTSPSVGAPNVEPRVAACWIDSTTIGWAWPRIEAP